MSNKIPIKKCGDTKLSHVGIAVQIKKMLNDILDVAYKDEVSPAMLAQFKRFTIMASEAELRRALGDCWHNKDGSASIRILGLGRDRYQESLIVAIHEVSHHLQLVLYKATGHGELFYEIHKKLLFAAFDMGILKVEDVTEGSESRARNKNKLARMMSEYVPRPFDYKSDTITLFVYNAYAIKEKLKTHGYHWNGLDQAWTKELLEEDLEDELQYLQALSIPEADIKQVRGGAVVTRLRKSAKLFNVPYEQNKVVKQLGYRWVDAKKHKYWRKLIDGDKLPEDEAAEIKKIPGVRVVID